MERSNRGPFVSGGAQFLLAGYCSSERRKYARSVRRERTGVKDLLPPFSSFSRSLATRDTKVKFGFSVPRSVRLQISTGCFASQGTYERSVWGTALRTSKVWPFCWKRPWRRNQVEEMKGAAGNNLHPAQNAYFHMARKCLNWRGRNSLILLPTNR